MSAGTVMRPSMVRRSYGLVFESHHHPNVSSTGSCHKGVMMLLQRGPKNRRIVAAAAAGSRNRTAVGHNHRLFSSLVTHAPIPTRPPKTVGALVSRRQWNKLYKPPPRKPPPKDNLDNKPWPRSVQIFGYVLATTVVPFTVAWYIASNVTIRNLLSPYLPGMAPLLRRWFGEPEEDALSYVDKRENIEGNDSDDNDGEEKLVMPLSLESEPCSKTRREQEEIDALTSHSHVIPTRLRVYAHGGFNLGEIVNLPGDTPANETAILGVLMKDRAQSIDPESVSHVSIEFVNSTPEEEKSTVVAGNDFSVEIHLPPTTGSDDNSNANGDKNNSDLSKLRKAINIFSSWHYFPVVAQQSSTASTSTNQTRWSQDDLRMSELEYQIKQLERELKNHTTMRDFDEIENELRRSKSELRRLRWKRRLGLSR